MMMKTEKETIDFLIECGNVYYNTGDVIIPDSEYDELYRNAQLTWPNNPFFQQIGAPVRGSEIKHTNQIGGLEQVHEGELEKWKSRTNYANEDLLISEKLDGSSLTIKYNSDGVFISGYTRGDGVSGADVSRHVRLMSIPMVINNTTGQNLEIRGEFIIKKSNFEIVKEKLKEASGKEYKNLRGIANGLINSKEIPLSVFPYLDFVAYGINSDENQVDNFKFLKENNFKTPHYIWLSHISCNESALNEIIKLMRLDSEYEIDGIVCEYSDSSKRKSLGIHSTSCNPKYAFKWKTRAEDNIAQVKVEYVEWNISKHKYLKPTVIIEPIDLCGITISRCSGFNAKFIKDNNIGPGAIISITRAGDVIPDILEVIKSADTWDAPDDFEWEWNETGVDAVSKFDNDDVRLLQLKHFFNQLDIDNVQEATLKTLMSNGFSEIIHIISMSEEEWEHLIGKNGIKAYNSLHSKLNDIYLWELLGAWPYFGRGFGKRRAKAIVDALGQKCLSASLQDIIKIEGFQEKTANVFVNGLSNFLSFYNILLDNSMIQLKQEKQIDNIDGSLSGEKFVFTGFRNAEFEVKIVELGGEVQSGIKKDTTVLVMKDPSKTSNKTKAALEQGIKIISIQQLEEMLYA
jgi:DNA ligase (NAD+)